MRYYRIKRPKNLDLWTIHFPLPAIVSICHRLSGAYLFLAIPLLLWILKLSLTPVGFTHITTTLNSTGAKLFLCLLCAPFYFHLIAGVRHLFMDAHLGTSRRGGQLSAQITFILAVLLTLLTGIYLW